jgi:uncharacterized protein YyaL (SSP411 family)
MDIRQNNHPANRLAYASSPYLLQHAHNPVDWYPWGDEAFAKARAENKLVLVSIGYSSCHWCHVMERESFENEAIAALMNAHYVCIKVDREERPDVDHVYMTAVQLMTQRGGWPLNCFTLPDGRPVYGGTYFPPVHWGHVLTDLQRVWSNDPKRLIEHAERLRKGVIAANVVEPPEEDGPFTGEVLRDMVKKWADRWDPVHGGPDHAPKFPMPNNLEFLLRYARTVGDARTERHVRLTLDQMAFGGLYDQIGGGFARYSTDIRWKVPHFEKMLYDNAQLISLYAQAHQAFGDPHYKRVVERTIGFVTREMTGPDGAFFSALDADSEGVEGLYYTWTREELAQVLGQEFDLAAAYYNVDATGLWEHGRYILLRTTDDATFAASFGIGEEELRERIRAIDERLMEVRSTRVRPGLDDKALTSWNALMVKALCEAYEVFGEKTWLEAALRNMRLLLTQCRSPEGGLLHTSKNGKAAINGYLDDHAFVIEALVALYGVTFDETWLHHAERLAEFTIIHFMDEESGAFHFTSRLDPPLIARPLEMHDNVLPASNSSMAKGLFLLGHLFDNERYLSISNDLLALALPGIAAHPSAHSNWAQLLLAHAYPFHEIAIMGPDALALHKGFARHYIPNRLFLGSNTASTLPLLKDKPADTNAIFVCLEKTCALPVNTVEAALGQLR